jgi:DNA-binding response OmpR family regulator
MMPHMDGVELIRSLASSDTLNKVPVILMSAAAHAPVLDHPDARFRRKPLSIDDLLALVAHLVSRA